MELNDPRCLVETVAVAALRTVLVCFDGRICRPRGVTLLLPILNWIYARRQLHEPGPNLILRP